MAKGMPKPFEVRIEHFVGKVVGLESAGQTGDPQGRFARFHHRRMNQEHEGVWNKTRRKASLFPAGKLLNTAPPAFFSAVIGQARMIAADAL